jgi:thymidylate synthase
MNKLDKSYTDLLQDILENGVEKEDRTGTGTLSVFGRQIRHSMKNGFPLLTTKKMPFKTVVTELLWFLQGRTDLRYLLKNNCHIWTGDSYKVYDKEFDLEYPPFSAPYPLRLTHKEFEEKIMSDDEFNKRFGDLGPIYGKQWRSWENYGYRGVQSGALDMGWISEEDYKKEMYVDQIQNLINDLKTDPDSRRLMVNSWNVSEISQMVLPPCHYGFQVYTRELSLEERRKLITQGMFNQIYSAGDSSTLSHSEINQWNVPTRAISLMYNARSQDVPLGTPFNISSYALLLEIIGRMVNMVPDELITNMGDCHIYLNQIEGIKEQLTREPYDLPKLKISDDVNFNGSIDDFLDSYDKNSFELEDYKSHPTIKIPLSN